MISRFLGGSLSLHSPPPGGRSFPTSPTSRPPFDRLKFWTVNPLGLNLYTVTEYVPAFTSKVGWDQFRFWSMLLDGDDEGIGELMGWETELPEDPKAWLEDHRVKA